MKNINFKLLLPFVLAALFTGYLLLNNSMAESSENMNMTEGKMAEKTKEQSKATIWSCSMHPQIQMPKPGKCPICGMTLIPVSDSAGDEKAGPREYTMSEAAKKLAEVVTEPVKRKFVDAQVRMVGKVDFDETRVGYITAWIPGRLDKLYVDYTGVPVKKGDHMVSLYSPELLAAQEELLQAVKSVRNLKSGKSKYIESMARNTLRSAREKLRLWGLNPRQTKKIEESNRPSDHLTIYAPMSGIVIHKNAFEGMYVKTGTRIYTIADLSRLWVQLDAYESDLMWVRYGQKVEFTSEAYPGEVFKGRISFIDPVLNAKTRTVKVRVNMDNPDGKLKPEMFVRAVVHANVAKGGRVMDSELAGKWICPMHPDFLSDKPGKCDICGMTLRKTESLGYVKEDTKKLAPLVVPVSAVLKTGKRAVVYVSVPNRKMPTYEGREINLGPRTGDYYLVRSGLAEGEMVVTNGNFKIDSALQIMAKPSMMSPEGGVPMKGHAGMSGMGGAKMKKGQKMSEMSGKGKEPEHDHKGHQHDAGPKEAKGEDPFAKVPAPFQKQVTGLLKSYLKVQELLVKDDANGTSGASGKLMETLKAMDMKLLKGPFHNEWMKLSEGLKEGIETLMTKKEDIQAQRAAFALVSEDISGILERFGFAGESKLFRISCPMAFDGRGANWIQEGKETRNPYLGTAMPGCGEMMKEY